MTEAGDARGTLILADSLETVLVGCARAAFPREACGLLVGHREGSHWIVGRVVESPNLATRTDRFELDPAVWVATELDARGRGESVLGVWHNHPRRPTRPSALDLAGAPEGLCSLILGVTAAGGFAARAWLSRGETWIELELTRPLASARR